jgi:hypothetical protein
MEKVRASVPFDKEYFKKQANEGKQLSTKDTFSFIYKENHWAGDKSISGAGSDFTQTEEIRKQLEALIKELNIKTFLDLPCGDFNWMSSINLDIEKYIGADIVPELVANNKQTYENAKRTFLHLDLIKDKLPDADIIFCRDCLVHLSNEDIQKALLNIFSSNIKYLLTTTFTDCEKNENIITGDWRVINLQKPPFELPGLVSIINERCTEGNGTYSDKSLGLWKIN